MAASAHADPGLGITDHQRNSSSSFHATTAPLHSASFGAEKLIESLDTFAQLGEILQGPEDSRYGDIASSIQALRGWQNAATSGIANESEITRRRESAMEDIAERRSGDVIQDTILDDAPAAEEVAIAEAGEGAEDGQLDRQGRLSDEAEVKEATTKADEMNGKGEGQDPGIVETATTKVPAQTQDDSQGRASVAVMEEPTADAVHIVDSDNNDAHVDALQSQAAELNLKTEMASADLALPLSAQSTLMPPLELDTTTAMAPMDGMTYDTDALLEAYSQEAAAPVPAQPATGFAKLEFQDGHFYMTTYAVELGRDMRAYRVAQQFQARQSQPKDRSGGKRQHQRSASVPGTPVRPAKADGMGLASARSFLSESGGIVGEDDGHIKLRRRRKKTKGAHSGSKSKSTDSSQSSSNSRSLSRKNSIVSAPVSSMGAVGADGKFNYNLAASLANPQQTVDPNATAPLDPMVHMPDPHFTPLIPVHPPMNSEDDSGLHTGKGISRKHIRISYNFDRCHFEMSVYGRNGAFLDEQHHAAGSTVPLKDGSMIQIGGVSLRFVLPTVALQAADRGDSEFDSVSGRMSFNFEDAHGESIMADEDDDGLDGFSSPSARARGMLEGWEDDELLLDGASSETDQANEDDDEEEESEEEVLPKKRGPGRPRNADRHPTVPSARDRRASQTVAKTPTKLKIKLSAKDKARERERLRRKAEEEERERRRQEAKAKAAKLKAKEAAKAKAKAEQAAEAKRKAKEEEARAKEASDVIVKEEGKEASKTPAVAQPARTNGEQASSKEPSAPRIARDAPMQNGEDINVPGLPAGMIIPARKKGPGRPPKDGVMSKRERAQLIKQAKEREKAIKMGMDPSLIPPPTLSPPRKPPKPRRDSQGNEIPPSPSALAAVKPARSPSPEMRIEDYTEEQLQRPSANYVYLIYEAIRESKAGVMNLQGIYASIERRYPWYRFRAGSHGWQSSVRHNLGQHEAFKKVEKEGKGWLWGIKEGVPIERERKKKSPPPQAPPHYGHGYPQYPQPYSGQYPQYPPGQQGQYQQRPPGAPPANGQPSNYQQRPQNGPPPPHGQYTNNGPHPPNGQRPPNYHQNQRKHYKPPSKEVIDTFKKVFISTYASRNDNNTAKAEAIVTNAIKRVLEPETMIGVAKDAQEENVMKAFEGILVQANGGPRYQGPGVGGQGQRVPPPQQYRPPPQPMGTLPPGVQGPQPQGFVQPNSQPQPNAGHGYQGPLPTNAGPSGTQAPQAQGQTYNVPPPQRQHVANQPPGASASPPAQIPPQAAASAASHAAIVPPAPQQYSNAPGYAKPPTAATQRQQGPAEQNLFGMLIQGPASRSASNTPIPPHPVHEVARVGAKQSPPIGTNGGPSPAMPAITPNAPPIANSVQSVHPSQTLPAAAVAGGAPANPDPLVINAPASVLAQPPPAITTPEGLGLNVNTSTQLSTPKDAASAILERPNGIPRTMTPTRPAVEPLTPPLVASPKVNTPAASSAASAPLIARALATASAGKEMGSGVKRARSPEREEAEIKKVKVDEG